MSIWSIEAFRETVRVWAAAQADVVAVLLVGSYARSRQNEGSDVDLVVVLEDPVPRLQSPVWTSHFGEVLGIRRGDYGPVQSLFVTYRVGPEVELGLTGRVWLDLARHDAETRSILQRGAQVWYDPSGAAEQALTAER